MVKFELQLFTPGEAVDLTGTDNELQKSWRKRGFIASQDGKHARFDLFSLCELFFLRVMSERGGPQRGKALADLAVAGLAFGALLLPQAIDGNLPGYDAKERAAEIVRKTARSRLLKSGWMPARYLIFWADDRPAWSDSLDDAVRALPPDGILDKLGRPLLVLDQHVAGLALAANARRPFVKITHAAERVARKEEREEARSS